jgi:hypothetical protein
LNQKFDKVDPHFRSLNLSSENTIASLNKILSSISPIEKGFKDIAVIKDSISSLSSPDSCISELKNIRSSINSIDNREDLSKKAFDNLFSLVYDKLEENKCKLDLFLQEFGSKLPSQYSSNLPPDNEATDQFVDLFQSSSLSNKKDKGKQTQNCHSPANLQHPLHSTEKVIQHPEKNVCSCHEKISELKFEHELLEEVNNKLDHLIELGNQPVLDINSKLLVMESNNDKRFNLLLEKFNSLQSSVESSSRMTSFPENVPFKRATTSALPKTRTAPNIFSNEGNQEFFKIHTKNNDPDPGRLSEFFEIPNVSHREKSMTQSHISPESSKVILQGLSKLEAWPTFSGDD